MDSLQKYNKYKEDKRLAKLIAKTEHDIEKRRISLHEKAVIRAKAQEEAAKAVAQKRLTKYVRKKDRWLNEKIRKELGRKPLKSKMPDLSKIRNKAHSEIQRYARLSRADAEGYVILLDTGDRVKRNEKGKVNGGHYYGKKNRPHLAFDLDNIRPISSGMNERQGENEGSLWREGLIARIGIDKFNEMEKKAADKALKSQIRQHDYYQSMYENYSKLNLHILHSRGWNIK